MSGLSRIKSALVKKFVATGLFTADKVAWENKSFVPPPQGPWASVFFVPDKPRPLTLGPGGMDEVVGFLQIDLNFPPNSGDQAVQAMAGALEEAFTTGSRLSYGGVDVTVRSSGRSPGGLVGSFWRMPVTVQFYSQYGRAAQYDPIPPSGDGDDWEALALRSWAEVEGL